mmetsp:Transcript_4412/g.11561  ORF Transcript_4412/g.11561 Transcript_4412/m.11561 type:complete len:290 (+) Transcript_4412:171-1040(+)
MRSTLTRSQPDVAPAGRRRSASSAAARTPQYSSESVAWSLGDRDPIAAAWWLSPRPSASTAAARTPGSLSCKHDANAVRRSSTPLPSSSATAGAIGLATTWCNAASTSRRSTCASSTSLATRSARGVRPSPGTLPAPKAKPGSSTRHSPLSSPSLEPSTIAAAFVNAARPVTRTPASLSSRARRIASRCVEPRLCRSENQSRVSRAIARTAGSGWPPCAATACACSAIDLGPFATSTEKAASRTLRSSSASAVMTAGSALAKAVGCSRARSIKQSSRTLGSALARCAVR